MSEDDYPTPEEDEALARDALTHGDLQHAIFHIACALAQDCQRRQRITLLDDIIAASPDPLALVPLEEDNFYATVAVRAYILNHLGQAMEAIDLLRQIAAVKPNATFVQWVVNWLTYANRTTLQLNVLLDYLGAHINTLQDWHGEAFKQQVEAGLSICQRLDQHYPQTAALLSIQSAYLRHLNRMDEALHAAQSAYDLSANWHTATCIAFVHRDSGRVEEAMQAYQLALQYEPEDITARLDMADMLCEHQRFAAGLHWYETVLALECEHPWALPSSYYCKAILQEKNPWYAYLSKYAVTHTDNTHAQSLLQRLIEQCGDPYVDYLPEAVDASIQTLRKFYEGAEETDSSGLVRMTVSVLEAPSSRLAIHHAMQALNPENPIYWDIQYLTVPEPDPRLPWGDDTQWCLWRYQDNNAEPGFAPTTSKKITHFITNLAQSDYRLDAWWGRATMIAHELNADAVEDLLAIMVHPPMEQTFWSWEWIQRVQTAAAFILANIGDGWANTVKRRALLAILQGPVDWPIVSAIIAITRLAKQAPDIAIEAQELFFQLFKRRPSAGYCLYLHPLIVHWLTLPNLDAAMKTALQEWKAGLENDAQEDADENAATPEAQNATTQKPWWQRWFNRD